MQILSRVSLEESEDEIKKLTISQHLLETNDDNWVTQNQVKLIFYNKSRQIDLNQKYRKNNKKQKDSFFFSFRLSDSKVSFWKDMVLYIMISLISIAYLLFATFTLQVEKYIIHSSQSQIKIFEPYIDYYQKGVEANTHVASLITKLSITPERYIQIKDNGKFNIRKKLLGIPSQYALFQFQQSSTISYILQSMLKDQLIIQTFNQDTTLFLEQLNLNFDHKDNNKIKANQQNFQERLILLDQQSKLSELNHLFKDNLCYYSRADICSFQEQIDFYNTGIIGALDQLQKFVLNREDFLQNFSTISFENQTPSSYEDQVSKYYLDIEFKIFSQYGQQIITNSISQSQKVMKDFFNIQKQNTIEKTNKLYIGIGVPIVVLTIILALVEMFLLKRKVRYIIMSLTYLPTFKFQDKIVLSLIKAVLKI